MKSSFAEFKEIVVRCGMDKLLDCANHLGADDRTPVGYAEQNRIWKAVKTIYIDKLSYRWVNNFIISLRIIESSFQGNHREQKIFTP